MGPIERALARIDTSLSEKLVVDSLAREVGCSRANFARRFRAETGLPPHQYRNQKRIESARYLLLKTHERLIDIAIDLGFCSQSHFTQVFREHVGQTPQQFRSSLAARQTA